MTKTDQRYEHIPPHSVGDCHAACLATILEVPLSEVPRVKGITESDIENWWIRLGNWLMIRDIYLFKYSVTDDLEIWQSPSVKVWIASGDSSRGGLHCVVMEDDEIFHDPHPSRAGLSNIQFAEHIVVVNPAAHMRQP